jgi:hypothetical protein
MGRMMCHVQCVIGLKKEKNGANRKEFIGTISGLLSHETISLKQYQYHSFGKATDAPYCCLLDYASSSSREEQERVQRWERTIKIR